MAIMAAGPRLRMSEKELTKGAKRILDDTEESGTRRWGEFTIKHGIHHEEWASQDYSS